MVKLHETTARPWGRKLSRRYVLAGGTASVIALNAGPARADDLSPWSDLFRLNPQDDEMVTSRQVNGFRDITFSIQQIADAPGSVANFDEYIVELSSNNSTLDPNGIFRLFRDHFAEFMDPSIATVVPYPDDLTEFFDGDAPGLGSAVMFNIRAGFFDSPTFDPIEHGAVMVTQNPGTTWVFTTITVPQGDGGAHPVSGNRQFGVREGAGGAIELFTRAVDRPNLNAAELLLVGEKAVLDGGDRLWKAMQQRVADFFAQYGSTDVKEPTHMVVDWADVETAVASGQL